MWLRFPLGHLRRLFRIASTERGGSPSRRRTPGRLVPRLEGLEQRCLLSVVSGPMPIEEHVLLESLLNDPPALAAGVPNPAEDPGEIHGIKWEDLDGDGLHDPDESPLENWKIYLDTNGNDQFDAGEPFALTDAQGQYAFTGLPPGNYRVGEVQQPGWQQTNRPASVGPGPAPVFELEPGFFTGAIAEIEPATGRIVVSTEGVAIWFLKAKDVDGDGFRDPLFGGEDMANLDQVLQQSFTTIMPEAVGETNMSSTETFGYVNLNLGNIVLPGLPITSHNVQDYFEFGFSWSVFGSMVVVPLMVVGNAHRVAVGPGEIVAGIDFGNRRLSGIQGTTWEDLDGDGVRDPDEPGMAEVTVYADLDANGRLDDGEPSAVTDQDGRYVLPDLPPGTYTVAEVVPENYAQTFPTGQGTHLVTIESGQLVTGIDFGNSPFPGEIHGTVWEDLNANGVIGPGEPRMGGVTVYLDLSANGQLDAGEPSAVTDQLGRYVLTGLAPGSRTVAQILPGGYRQTFPAPAQAVHAVVVQPGQAVTDIDFGNCPLPGEVRGTVWEDLNGDGTRDPDEPGMADVTIYLDLDADGRRDTGEPSIVTDAAGVYALTNVPPGTYPVAEVVPVGYRQTFPTTQQGRHVVTVAPDAIVEGIDFANAKLGEIRGCTWQDLDGDGTRDASELGMPGVTVYLDLDRDGRPDPSEPSEVSAQNGQYAITSLLPGNYTVGEVAPDGYGQTAPDTGQGTHVVAVEWSQVVSGIDFGNSQAAPSAPDLVTYAGNIGAERFYAVHELSDGTILVSGAADDLSWVPGGTPMIELTGLAVDDVDSGATDKVGFLLHLGSDLSTIEQVVHFPDGKVEGIERIRTTEPPGQPTGDVYISGQRRTTTGDTQYDGYFIAKLDNNFVEGLPTGLVWSYNVNTPPRSEHGRLQPWDVRSDGAVIYGMGDSNYWNWAAIGILDANGQAATVENWPCHWGDVRPDGEWYGTASTYPGLIAGSGIVMKAGRDGSLRSYNQADFDWLQEDENGNPGRKGKYPDDYYFAGPQNVAGPDPGGPGYTGYRIQTFTARIGEIVVDRRNGDLYYGYNIQSYLPDGNPDFEPAVVAMDATGRMKWWARLYPEFLDNNGNGVFDAGDMATSTPDQYVDSLAIDYSNDRLVVMARCHGNNWINFWKGNALTLNPGGHGFQNQFTGNNGNIHLLWLGKYGLDDGRIYAATYMGDYGESDTRYGAIFPDGLLAGWPDPNGGWPDMHNTTSDANELCVDDWGRVYVAAYARRPFTTSNAYQQMVRPGDGHSSWSSFIRVYESDLSGLVYSSLLSGDWDSATEQFGKNTEIRGFFPVRGSVLVAGFHRDADDDGVSDNHPVPTANVPFWGNSTPLGEEGILARFVFEESPANAEVVGQHIFYNNSAFDGNAPEPGATDDEAIAADKTALLPGEMVSAANYTNYHRGINGIMVDISGLPDGVTPALGDFLFHVGNDDRPGDWEAAPTPTITVRDGAGTGRSDRVTITWDDNAIQNEWLQVTVRPDRLGLAEDDVFYFGNAVAETGNSDSDARVTVADVLLTRHNPRGILNPAPIDFPYDFNRDGRVNATDVLLARNHQTSFPDALELIDLFSPQQSSVPTRRGTEVARDITAWIGKYEPVRPSSHSTSRKRS